jgi:hypothetical protein
MYQIYISAVAYIILCENSISAYLSGSRSRVHKKNAHLDVKQYIHNLYSIYCYDVAYAKKQMT